MGAARRLSTTTSLCPRCKRGIAAEIEERGSEVWMRKACPDHGAFEVRLSTDSAWYQATEQLAAIDAPPPHVARDIEHGCPFDCGPCASHTQSIKLPVVTITSACDLDCPICYVHNKNQDAFHMGRAELERVVNHLVKNSRGDLDLVNFTGGEPLLHPQIADIVERCQELGIHRVSVCTNGIRLVKDRTLLERLAKLGVRIALSFDSFEKHADYALQGANLVDLKLECLRLLAEYDMDTTLIPVMTKGYNDHEIGRIIELGLSQPNVRHLEVHTITYTGQSGVDFDRSGRISMVEVLDRIQETTGGLLRRSDFVPSPCAHPLCYQIAYLLVDPEGGPPLPFTRFMPRETLVDCLRDHLYLEPSPRLEQALKDAINQLWVGSGSGERSDVPTLSGADADRALNLLESLLRRLFPKKPLSAEEALRISERAAKAVYVHSHMDEETFDVERVKQCCDSNCYADGSSIPVCNYNILYREKESRFMQQPKSWQREGGRRLPLIQPGANGG
ncbi:MAG: radical SAM protein [Polyangiaceae bacterium]